jgi:menaquinone C8-methyltransferase
VIQTIITWKTRRELDRLMRFADGRPPALFAEGVDRPRLLYLHVPFCEKLCPYCSFHRVAFQEQLCRAYFRALRGELSLYRELGFTFRAAYVGGGTPTILMDELSATIAHARRCFALREVSAETNPNHLTADHTAALQQAGVDRLSVGIQSFDDGLLRDMDRLEKYGSGEETAARLRSVIGRFGTVNADMIFNFPSQTEAMLVRDIETLRGTGVDQVTYYPLMVSDGTRAAVARSLGRVDFRREERFYHRIVAGLVPPYRFSSAWCFSRKPASIDEYIIAYDEYAGLGSGAIGYLNGMCYANTFDIEDYIARVGRGELPVLSSRVFTPAERVRYDFLMKLFGLHLSLGSLRAKHGPGSLRHLWWYVPAFLAAGSVRPAAAGLSLTRRGRYQWVIIMREFFTAVNNFRDFCRRRAALPSAAPPV